MSDLSRLQQLAEAVGWKVRECDFAADYTLTIDGKDFPLSSLRSIRTRLAAKYRELAEQAQRAFETHMRLKYPTVFGDGVKGEINASHYLCSIADELSAPEGPTMLQRLEEAKHFVSNTTNVYGENLILDALIDLYERKEK